MKNLFSIMCTMILVFGFAAGQAFAIGYSKDINPTIQPGTDFDDEITIPAGTQVTIDVQVNDVSLPLISAGVSLVYDPDMITVISSSIYDSEEIAREDGGTNWDPELSNTIDMGPLTVPYEGLNGYTVLCGELDLVSPLNGDIPVARFVLECQDPGDAEVMFMPSIDVDTVVGEGGIVFDGDIVPNTVIIHQVEDTDGDGLFDYQDNCPEHPNGPELGTCTRGTVGEICSSNQNCGTGGVCSMNQEDMDIDGVGDVCDTVQICKGNFDFDGDVDGTDAALFKSHFGRGGYTNPCPPMGQPR